MRSHVEIHSDELPGPVRLRRQAQIALDFLAVFCIRSEGHRMAAELHSLEFPNSTVGNRKVQCDKLPARAHTMDRDETSRTANRNWEDHRAFRNRLYQREDTIHPSDSSTRRKSAG